MDEQLTKNIIKASKSIREKYKQIKSGKIESDLLVETNLKPITVPLEEIVTEIKATYKKSDIKTKNEKCLIIKPA